METNKTGNNKTMMIIIIALLVILLGAIGTVAFLFLNAMGGEKKDPNYVPAMMDLNPDQIELVPLSDKINTNLAQDQDGVDYYIRVGIALGVNNTQKEESIKFIDLVKSKEVMIRDTALGVIRSKTAAQLQRPDGREVLRSELLTRLQDTFKNNLLVDIYLDDFIIQ